MKIYREAENSKPSQSHISAEGAARQQVHVAALEPSVCTPASVYLSVQ